MGESQPPAARYRSTSVARALLGALALVVLAFTATVVVPGLRPGPGFVPLYEGWLQCGGYVLCAVIATIRVVAVPRHRLLWAMVAIALVLRAVAFLWRILVVRLDATPAYPSLADVGWLVSGLLFVAALGVLAHTCRPRTSRTLVLDSVLGALTAAAVAVAFLYPSLVRLTAPGTPVSAILTNLAYPVVDVAMLMIVAGLLTASGGRLPRAAVALSVGLVAMSVVDAVFLYQLAAGTFRPGTLLQPLSLAGTATVALACWLPLRMRPSRPVERPAGLVTPVALALVCIGTLLYDATRPVDLVGVVLAAAGLVVAIVRGLVTLTTERREATATLGVTEQDRERFRALVEASGDFIALADLTGRVVYVNPGGRRLVGMTPDADVSGTVIADYLTPRALEVWERARRPAVLSAGHWEGESELRDHRGGAPIPVAVSTFTIRDPGTGAPWLMATVQRDISDRLEAEHAMADLAEQRRVLLDHLVQAQEDERARIAADVHDDTVQALAAVELRLALMHRELARDAPQLLPRCEDLRETVRGAMERLRTLLFDLESPARDGDLPGALEAAAAFVFEDSVRWRVDDRGVAPPQSTRVTAYRIAKEAMVNVRKHADASEVVVSVRRHGDGIEVVVVDDGRGFDPEAPADRPGHLGLTGMRDRATVAGGRVKLTSERGQGTTVRLWLPCHEESSREDALPPGGDARARREGGR